MEQKTLLSSLHITTVGKVDKLFFTQNLLTMIKAGFPLDEALKTLSQQTKKKEFKNIILDLQQQVENGVSFHQSLKKYPHVFSELFISMIAAGEVSGKLEESLTQLLIQMKKSYALTKKIRNALMYPCIIIIAMIILGIGMMIFVLPNLIKLYSESGFTLPLPTRIVISISKFLIANGWWVGIVCFILIIAFIVFIRNQTGKIVWHTIILKLPIISGIMKKINLAKMSRTMNSLIATDLPIIEDFKIIAQTLGNRIYRQHLLSSTESLKKGQSIANTLKTRPDLFPPVMTQMINVGEQSGTLDHITKELAEFYEDEVSDTMANLTVIIEPIIMLVVGAGVAFVAVSVIYPIYALVNQI
jgi:type IV pilus assembly protein PilC